jgi:hypothetical protein
MGKETKKNFRSFQVIIYYSGEGFGYSQPETFPKEKNVMLTYWKMRGDVPYKRFQRILKARQQELKGDSNGKGKGKGKKGKTKKRDSKKTK